MDLQVVWLIVLTLGLVAHMVKDAQEFKKIKKIEGQLSELKAGGPRP